MKKLQNSRLIWLALPVALCLWGVAHYFANKAEKESHRMAVELRKSATAVSTDTSEADKGVAQAISAIEMISSQNSSSSDSASLARMLISTMEEADTDGGKMSKATEAALSKRMSEATLDELGSLIAELEASSASRPVKEKLEMMVYEHMAAKDIRKALELGLTRIYTAPYNVRRSICEIFRTWSWKNPGEAEEWLDQQIANGMFDSQSSDGFNRPLNGFETAMWNTLIAQGRIDALFKRLEKSTETVRKHVIEDIQIHRLKPEQEKKFFDIVRSYFDEKIDTLCFQRLVATRAMDHGYEAASQTIERVGLPRYNLAAVVRSAAGSRIYNLSCKGPVAQKDFDEARNWNRKHAPEALNAITSDLLVTIAETRRVGKYEESMRLLDSLKDDPGRDEIILGFIQGLHLEALLKQSIPLVDSISDAAIREKARDYSSRSIQRR